MRYCKQLTSMALTMGVLLAMACGESPVTVAADLAPSFAKGGNGGGGGGGRGGGPGSGDDGDPAQVVVRDAGGDAVTSDGDPLYVDGVETVNVAITATDFHFQMGTHKKKANRDLALKLGPSTDGSSDPFGGEQQVLDGVGFRIHEGIVTIACDGVEITTHGRFLFGSSLGMAHLAFGVPGIDPEGGLAGDLLTVSRVDNEDGTSTWTITSDGAGYLRLEDVFEGTFEVPFQFTVTGEPGCS